MTNWEQLQLDLGLPERPPVYTIRGFRIYDVFSDSHGNKIRVQESSAADEPKVWVLAEPGPGIEDPAPHLTVDQAKRLILALAEFVGRKHS